MMLNLRKIVLKSVILSVIGMALLGVGYLLLPKPDIKRFIPYSSAYFDQHDALLRLTLADDGRYRLYQPLEEFSPSLIKATILYEDQDFYKHIGVDFMAIARAAWQTYVKQNRRIGASTITMQFARLRWGIPSNNIRGKLTQIFRALQLNKHYSKNEILEAYLNIAPYGGNVEGVSAASLIYFNKKPSELNLPEALTLAVIPQNPNKRNPSKRSNQTIVKAARQRLLSRWLNAYPSDSSKVKQFDLPMVIRSNKQLPFTAPHFINHVHQQRSQWEHGVVQTTLDRAKQRSMEAIIKRYIAEKKSLDIKNAAAMLLNYETMEVEAMVGSANFHDIAIEGQVNGTTAKRSPGSTLKPFVYGLAMDEGLIHPLSLLKDSPRRFGGFTPENYDKQFWGPISAKNALIESRNVPAVDLQSQLKERSFHQFLTEAGITELKDESHYGLALALGGGEVSMLELTSLYAMLANQGQMRPIKTMRNNRTENNKTKVKTKKSKLNQKVKQLLSPEASFLVLDMLKDNPAPNALSRISYGHNENQIAWKTGTSWAFRDAWSVGVSGPYVLAVWVGNFNSEGNDAFVGRTAAGPLLFSLFRAVNPNNNWRLAETVNTEQLNLKRVDVCAETGDLYEQYCQAKTQTWFISGVSPIKLSNVYRNISIDKKTGLRACPYVSEDTEKQVYEFWPSDFLHIFKQAGITRRTPPPYHPSCSLADRAAVGIKPTITSPQSGLEYKINMASKQSLEIPFKAIIDSDVNTLHWFVDNSYVGSVEDGTALLWQAKAGDYEVKAVDDSGRSTYKKITVSLIQ